MNYRTLLFMISIIPIPVFAADAAKNTDPKEKIKKVFPITGFSELELRNRIVANIVPSKDFFVEVEGAREDVEDLEVRKEDNRLIMGHQGIVCVNGTCKRGNRVINGCQNMRGASGGTARVTINSDGMNIVTDGSHVIYNAGVIATGGSSVTVRGADFVIQSISNPIHATIHLPLIAYLAALNGSVIRVDGVETDKLELYASHSSRVAITRALCKKLKIAGRYSSAIVVKGVCDEVQVTASYSALVDAYDLKAQQASVNASRSASVRVSAEKELKACSSYNASVAYGGSPAKIDKEKSHSGTIEKVGMFW